MNNSASVILSISTNSLSITNSCSLFASASVRSAANNKQASLDSIFLQEPIKMSPPKKTRKMVIKIPRHPYIMAQRDLIYQEHDQVRKCRVNLEKLKGQHATVGRPFPLKPKPKRCCVRVARLPNVERSELSVTPASSLVCSDFDDGK